MLVWAGDVAGDRIASFLVVLPLLGTAKQYMCTCAQHRICTNVCMCWCGDHTVFVATVLAKVVCCHEFQLWQEV